MTLGDLADLADIVGAIGVIATIIYLAVEIRRNTAATRQQSYHDLVTRRADWFQALADSRDLTKIFWTGMNGDRLDETDSQRFTAYMINCMSHYQDVYLQHRVGIVEKGVWTAERRILGAIAHAPGFNGWWQEANQYFMPEFVDEVTRVEHVDPVIYDQESDKWSRAGGKIPTGN